MILAILYLSQVLGTSPLNANVINECEQASMFQRSAWKFKDSNWRIVSLLPIIIEGPIEINYSYNPSQINCFTSWRPASKNMKITKSKVHFVYTSFTHHPLWHSDPGCHADHRTGVPGDGGMVKFSFTV